MSIAPGLDLVGQHADGTPSYAYFLTESDPVPALLARIAELETANTDLEGRLDKAIRDADWDSTEAATRHAAEIAMLQKDLADAHSERIAFACELDQLTEPHDQNDFDSEVCAPDCQACATTRQEAWR